MIVCSSAARYTLDSEEPVDLAGSRMLVVIPSDHSIETTSPSMAAELGDGDVGKSGCADEATTTTVASSGLAANEAVSNLIRRCPISNPSTTVVEEGSGDSRTRSGGGLSVWCSTGQPAKSTRSRFGCAGTLTACMSHEALA